MKIFVHDHSPLAGDCNPGCGWYELGVQLTYYSTREKTQKDTGLRGQH